MRSVLTGKEPVDRVKELVLDEHEECGCECSPELASLCAGESSYVSPVGLFTLDTGDITLICWSLYT